MSVITSGHQELDAEVNRDYNQRNQTATLAVQTREHCVLALFVFMYLGMKLRLEAEHHFFSCGLTNKWIQSAHPKHGNVHKVVISPLHALNASFSL